MDGSTINAKVIDVTLAEIPYMDLLQPRQIIESTLVWYSNDTAENNQEQHEKIKKFGENIKDSYTFAQCSES